MNSTPAPVLRRLLAAGCSVVVASGLLSAATPVSAHIVTELPKVRAGAAAPATTPGIGVSRWQGTITWASVRNAGVQFAYLKATEGTGVKDPNFNTYYPAAYYAGLIRGAYHFARPNLSAGSTQADYFASNGGAWSADNQTLPGALDIEPNPSSGGYCYGLSQSSMVNWISSFMNQYHSRTGRWAVIHTTASFWRICTGNYSGFASRHPLSIVQWDTSVGLLPAGWSFYTFWQDTDCRVVSGISGCAEGNVFNGARDRLVALANNTA